LFIRTGTRFSSCGECDMDQLGTVSVYSCFLNKFWIMASGDAFSLLCDECGSLVSSSSVRPKPTLMIPNNFVHKQTLTGPEIFFGLQR
jgi:hypothetical protein